MFDDDDELFLRYSWSTKNVYVLFPAGPLSEFFAIANLRHASSRIWTCAESEFRFCWMKLCRSDNRNITAPQISGPKLHSPIEWEKTSDKWILLLKTRVSADWWHLTKPSYILALRRRLKCHLIILSLIIVQRSIFKPLLCNVVKRPDTL